MSGDPFDLARFLAAQQPVIGTALAELRAGRKRTHWMWFVFPQLRGLGLSPMAERYDIASPAEARAYLAHDLLGPPDDAEFRSSMTLFAAAAPDDDGPFERALDAFCEGRRCDRTLAMLRGPRARAIPPP